MSAERHSAPAMNPTMKRYDRRQQKSTIDGAVALYTIQKPKGGGFDGHRIVPQKIRIFPKNIFARILAGHDVKAI